jgi:hypothetical protein
MFSVIRGVLLAPLPFPKGDELVLVQQSAPASNVADAAVSIQELDDYRARLQSVRDLVEFHSMSFVLLNQGEPDRIQAAVVSANFFDMLGVRPLLGRTFRKGDDDIGADAVLVLSHEYWQSKFGGEGRRHRPRPAHEQPAAHGGRRAAAVPRSTRSRATSTCRRRRARSGPGRRPIRSRAIARSRRCACSDGWPAARPSIARPRRCGRSPSRSTPRTRPTMRPPARAASPGGRRHSRTSSPPTAVRCCSRSARRRC